MAPEINVLGKPTTIYTLDWIDGHYEVAYRKQVATKAGHEVAKIVLPCGTKTRIEKAPIPRNAYRWWFICPRCKTRRNRLYHHDGKFRCRICHDLRYAIQRETSFGRRMLKVFGSYRSEPPAWQCHPKGEYVVDERLGV